jgi:inner membrane transporter RhtA
VVLGELLSVEQWVALVCVVIASVGATRSSPTAAPAPD